MFSSRARHPLVVKFPAHGVWTGESRHGRGFVMPEVAHEFLKVLYPIAGRGWIERTGARSPLVAGDVVLVPAGCAHRLVDDARRPLSLYVMALRNDVVAALPGGADITGSYRHCVQPAWRADVRDAIRLLLQEQTLAGPGSAALSWGAAWTVLGRVWRMSLLREPPESHAAKSADPVRARVAAYASGLSETFIRARGLDETAAELGLSRRRFTELFREVTGSSWKRAVRGHQVAHACRLLRETERSVLSISYECGFSDVSSFHRAFRAETALPPASWRMRHACGRAHTTRTKMGNPNAKTENS